jgi:hypothetical protein
MLFHIDLALDSSPEKLKVLVLLFHPDRPRCFMRGDLDRQRFFFPFPFLVVLHWRPFQRGRIFIQCEKAPPCVVGVRHDATSMDGCLPLATLFFFSFFLFGCFLFLMVGKTFLLGTAPISFETQRLSQGYACAPSSSSFRSLCAHPGMALLPTNLSEDA